MVKSVWGMAKRNGTRNMEDWNATLIHLVLVCWVPNFLVTGLTLVGR